MPTILIIDDDESTRETLRETLELEGHVVLEAENGRVGLEVAAANAVSVVITDMFMPEMDGLETIRELRKINPETGIVALSGGGRWRCSEPLEEACRLGVCKILTKPVRRKDIIAAITDCVHLRR